MYAGQVQEEGVVDDVLKNPLHPYTQALIGSVPDPDADGPLKQIPGEPPSLMSIAAGCRFAPRCERAYARCSIEQPRLHEVGEDRRVRCHLFDPDIGM
jgi:peptide/nickel transport system ATP-binding protein